MLIEYDPAKRASNLQKHGLDFEAVDGLLWGAALISVDDRQDYGEARLRALVPDAGGALHHVAFTLRDDALRVFSFRRANSRERKAYDEAQK